MGQSSRVEHCNQPRLIQRSQRFSQSHSYIKWRSLNTSKYQLSVNTLNTTKIEPEDLIEYVSKIDYVSDSEYGEYSYVQNGFHKLKRLKQIDIGSFKKVTSDQSFLNKIQQEDNDSEEEKDQEVITVAFNELEFEIKAKLPQSLDMLQFFNLK